MSNFYFDTSALVKYYITEIGSGWVQSCLENPSTFVFTSLLTSIESVCTFTRRCREGQLTTEDLAQMQALLTYDFAYRYEVLAVDLDIIETAQQLANRHPLRAYDAVQLATAWLANKDLVEADKPPLTFVCADVRLLAIARDEGLQVEDPAAHA